MSYVRLDLFFSPATSHTLPHNRLICIPQSFHWKISLILISFTHIRVGVLVSLLHQKQVFSKNHLTECSGPQLEYSLMHPAAPHGATKQSRPHLSTYFQFSQFKNKMAV
jgi:hypothetical protein